MKQLLELWGSWLNIISVAFQAFDNTVYAGRMVISLNSITTDNSMILISPRCLKSGVDYRVPAYLLPRAPSGVFTGGFLYLDVAKITAHGNEYLLANSVPCKVWEGRYSKPVLALEADPAIYKTQTALRLHRPKKKMRLHIGRQADYSLFLHMTQRDT